MAVAFRAATNKTLVGGGTLTINVPAGVADNDILVMIVATAGSARLPSTPAGWTSIDLISATGPSAQSYYRVAASEPASYNVTTTTGDSAAAMAAYTGGNTSTPINAHSAFNRLTSTSFTATTITPNIDGCMLVFMCGNSVSGATYTPPGSYNDRQHPAIANASVLLADLLQVSQAATGSVTATGTTSNSQSTIIAIAPPGAGAVSDVPSTRRRQRLALYR